MHAHATKLILALTGIIVCQPVLAVDHKMGDQKPTAGINQTPRTVGGMSLVRYGGSDSTSPGSSPSGGGTEQPPEGGGGGDPPGGGTTPPGSAAGQITATPACIIAVAGERPADTAAGNAPTPGGCTRPDGITGGAMPKSVTIGFSLTNVTYPDSASAWSVQWTGCTVGSKGCTTTVAGLRAGAGAISRTATATFTHNQTGVTQVITVTATFTVN